MAALAFGFWAFQSRQDYKNNVDQKVALAVTAAQKQQQETDAKKEAEDFFKRLQKYAFAEQASTSTLPTPACKQQPPLKAIYGGESSTYQHTFEQSGP